MFLFKLFKSCLRNSVIPVQWRAVSEVYILRVKPPNPSVIKDFRPIALLNVEGKLFFSLISLRMEDHLIKQNLLIDKSIQKGFMERVPGCWEHMSSVWSALKEASVSKATLAAIWLDIANAYGSVPHRLIFFALERYGVPIKWINLIKNCYSGLWSKSFSNNAPSDWHCHRKGIFIGCTGSIILFLSAMNVVIEYVCHHFNDSSLTTTPVKAFMDDVFLISSSVPNTQSLLDRCSTVLSWAGMSFRAQKSCSMVCGRIWNLHSLRGVKPLVWFEIWLQSVLAIWLYAGCYFFIICKGKVVDESPFSVSFGEKSLVIPSIQSQPVRFLGRTIESYLSDKSSIDCCIETFNRGLLLIHKSGHKGINKVWILQHLLIPRVRWHLQIYEFPMSTVIKMDQKCLLTSAVGWISTTPLPIELCFPKLPLVLCPSRILDLSLNLQK